MTRRLPLRRGSAVLIVRLAVIGLIVMQMLHVEGLLGTHGEDH
jgi:hypothetical protein